MHLKYSFFFLLFATLVLSQDTSPERKGFWVVRYALETPDKIDQIIQTAYSAGINDLFIQVRALGATYFKSSVENQSVKLAQDFDPLAYAINKAQLYDIRIHAWINMFYIWSGNSQPADSHHVFYRLNRAILRKNSFPAYNELKSAGIEGYFLDPQNKQVQNYLLNLLSEIADNYKLCGIHLDYFRYPDISYSFTPESRSNFMLVNWYDPLEVYASSEEYSSKRGYGVFMEADRQYRSFLNSGLTRFLISIRDLLHQKPRKIELSVAVKPDPVKAKHRYFQDWMRWLTGGLCDFIVVMNYNTDKNEFDRVLKQFRDSGSKKNVVMGISTYNQKAESVLERIARVRSERFAGFSLFSYNHLIENQWYLTRLMQKSKL